MSVLFDSRSLTYRSPFGAVAEGTEVLFRICLPRNWGCHGADLLVERDGLPTQYYGMFWAGMAGEDTEWWDIRFPPAEAGVYWYGFRLQVALGTGWLSRLPDGKAAYSATADTARWQLTCYERDFCTPDWPAGGIMYQIFPDRFCRSGAPKEGVPADRVIHDAWEESPVWRPDEQGRVWNNDYFSGDLRGITEKLDYLVSLGVTCLYLNPIFEAHSNHRYDTAEYTRIDPLLGDEEDFRRLTEAAAARGIRVMLDGVFSHTGSDSVYFNKEGRYPAEGAYNSPVSPYAGWYRFHRWPTDYASWWGFPTLPEVEETNPAFMDYINGPDGVVSRWLQAGASGWRLDVADELPDAFLDALRARAKATDPDALVLGEVWEDASNKESYGHRRRYLLGRQLDSVMNYPFRQAILHFLLWGGRREFFGTVLSVTENYPPQVLRLLMNHIGTHDTERVLTVLGGEPAHERGRSWQAEQRMTSAQRQTALARLRLATLLQFALPGVPCIYYGDEAGMEGYKDPFNRGTFPWESADAELTAWYRRLGAARRRCAALADGELLPLDSPEGTVCFVRQGGGEKLLCAVNREQEPRRVTLPPQWADATVTVGTGIIRGEELELPPLGGVWLSFSQQ